MVYQGAGHIKSKKIGEAQFSASYFAEAIEIIFSSDTFFRTLIVVLETARKGKYDLRIVLSLETANSFL